MSRPQYAEEYGPGHSDYYASDSHGYGYYEEPNYHAGYYDRGYDYNQDMDYHSNQNLHEYQPPSRIPIAQSSTLPRGHRRGPQPMNTPRRADQQQQFHPSAWDASQEVHHAGEYAMSTEDWPLPSPSLPPPEASPRSVRTPPRRPQRPDDPRIPEPRLQGSPQSTTRATPASRQYYQNNASSYHGNGHRAEEGATYASPPPNYPLPSQPPPQAAYPQSASPLYMIPQAPKQVVYGQANQRPPLGPPPSARRAPSSFYPQVGPVHPIVEETESTRSSVRTGSLRATSKVSVASSNAIPIGLEAPRMGNPNSTSSSSEESYVESPIEPALGWDRQNSHVRHASVGRKQRPILTTVKSGERRGSSASGSGAEITALPAMPQRSLSQVERERIIAKNKLEGQTQPGAADLDRQVGSAAVKAAAAAGVARAAAKAAREEPTDVAASGGIPPTSANTFQTPQSPTSPPAGNGLTRKRSKDFATLANELQPIRSQPRSPLAPVVDPRVETILTSLEKGGAISEQEAEELKSPMGGMSGRRRPPRLDVDAVRDAEARGSLSSLPELIRRATRLASNLDRGRTASRLGMNWLDGARDDEKRRSVRSSSILSAYQAGEGRAEKGASFGRFSRMMRHSSLGSDSDGGEAKPGRTCCGMPLWLFILLLILLVMLIAAAVVVPVLLVVVLPNNNSSTSSPSTLEQCQNQLTCDNGGTNILGTNGFCECLCVNGYTGTECQTLSPAGCTMTTIGSTENVTVGDSIPRLLEDANSNFSIPLDSETVLGLFSSSDLSCSAQNALVTFNGQSSKRSLFGVEAFLPELHRRQDDTPTSTTPASSSETATATSSDSSATPTATSDEQLDFARVAVLYVFEVSSELDHAATAQLNLQTYFRAGETTDGATADAQNISLGNGFTCNLDNLSLDLGNGTSVGGGA